MPINKWWPDITFPPINLYSAPKMQNSTTIHKKMVIAKASDAIMQMRSETEVGKLVELVFDYGFNARVAEELYESCEKLRKADEFGA